MVNKKYFKHLQTLEKLKLQRMQSCKQGQLPKRPKTKNTGKVRAAKSARYLMQVQVLYFPGRIHVFDSMAIRAR